jgi:hypothetical protein
MNRENLYSKIRALLAKTQENGCSEAEAMAALDKAQAMMDAYEVTDDDLKLTKEEKALIHATGARHDKYGVRSLLCGGIATFTSCKSWISRGFRPGTTKGQIFFCGLPSDVQLADWLLDSLENFVRGELTTFLMTDRSPRSMRRRIINGFLMGACGRISARLKELTHQSQMASTGNVKALVLVKNAGIADAMAAAGIRLRSNTSHRTSDPASYQAGQAMGDRAVFGRPVGGVGQRLIGR